MAVGRGEAVGLGAIKGVSVARVISDPHAASVAADTAEICRNRRRVTDDDACGSIGAG